MKTYSTQRRVEEKHIDKGNHANWLSQLRIAEEVQFAFRDELGIGLETLQEKHGLFLVMRTVSDVHYCRELRLGDTVNIMMTMWVLRPVSFGFECIFRKGNDVVTTMQWEMPLISATTGKVCLIPHWIKESIGLEKPES